MNRFPSKSFTVCQLGHARAVGICLLRSYQTVENVDDAAVLGHTTSYTDAWPEKDGETNFSRALDLPYARCEEGIAVYCDGVWQLFTRKG